MEINKTDDETLKKIANEINKTGVVKEKKDIRKDKKHTLEEKLLKSTISSNSKDVIKRTIKIDKGETVNIESNKPDGEQNQVILEFTLDDVRRLINVMERKNIIKPKNYIVNIPFIGRKLYEKAWFEQKKINILKEQLEKVENGTETDRRRFIDELEPLLSKKNK